MIENQLARRNITMAKRIVLNLILEPLLAAKAKERMQGGVKIPKSNPVVNSPQGSGSINSTREPTTRDLIGKASGTCGQTVSRVKVIMAKADEPTKEKMLSGICGRTIQNNSKNTLYKYAVVS
jgi:hypothetical protein